MLQPIKKQSSNGRRTAAAKKIINSFKILKNKHTHTVSLETCELRQPCTYLVLCCTPATLEGQLQDSHNCSQPKAEGKHQKYPLEVMRLHS